MKIRSCRRSRVWRAATSIGLVAFFVVAAAACDWPMAGFGPAHTNYNPFESRVNVVNVGSLHEVWSAATLGPDGAALVPPVVAGGFVFVATTNSPHTVQAFDDAGVARCSGSPKTCVALWTGTVSGAASSLGVSGGTLYVGTAAGMLFAFDAAGVEGCSGTPATCTPLWTASGIAGGSVVAAAGFVYASGSGGTTLLAFDAAGVEGCSGIPRVCEPLWSAEGGPPSVVNGIVYTSFQGIVRAYDARGVQGCTGTPKTCTPLWTAQEPPQSNNSTGPVVAQGLVFIGLMHGDESFFDGTLVAFDAAGVRGLFRNTEDVCRDLRAPTDGVFHAPAVAGDRLYVTDGFFNGSVARNTVRAFDVDACMTSRPACNPLWTAPLPTGAHPGEPPPTFASPAVANGVVYVRPGTTTFAAFYGAGNVNCSGPPKTCAPLVARSTSPDATTPVIVNGVMYTIDETLRAFALP